LFRMYYMVEIKHLAFISHYETPWPSKLTADKVICKYDLLKMKFFLPVLGHYEISRPIN